MKEQRIVLILFVTFLGCHMACGQEAGAITGKIINGITGNYLQGADVRVVGSGAETTSGQGGHYFLRKVPAGTRTLIIKYIGLGSHEETVLVASGQTVRRDIEFGGEVVNLETLVVDGALVGQARALNLQKTAS